MKLSKRDKQLIALALVGAPIAEMGDAIGSRNDAKMYERMLDIAAMFDVGIANQGRRSLERRQRRIAHNIKTGGI